jgi:predicted permease
MRHGTFAGFAVCTPGYFRVVGLPLRQGRDFTAADDSASTPVAIVTESLARQLWPGRDAIGRRLALVPADSVVWITVVGVVRDVVQDMAPQERSPAAVFLPHEQSPSQSMTLVVHSRGEIGALAARVRSVVQAADPDLPLIDVRSMREHLRVSMWDQRLYTLMLSLFSAVALLLAAVGIYGVMAYSVAQRTQEIGIRMALGAAGDAVVRMVVGQALRLTLIGAAIGLVGAFALTRLMASLLYQVRPDDPPTYLTVAVVLAGTALLAAWLPAWRATRVDPMVALRSE